MRVDAACKNGRLEIMKKLLSNGANINAKTIDGESVLHMAVREKFYSRYENSMEIIQFLLEDVRIDLR